MIRHAPAVATDTDEDRWAEAQSILDRAPTESAEQRIRRTRRLALSLNLVLVIGVSCAAFVTALMFADSPANEPSPERPIWQRIAGLGISGLAICVLIAACVLIVRTNRRLGAWRSPMTVLTRQQRRELLVQVRGRVPAEAARVPVARYLAVLLLSRRPVLVLNAGIALMFVGQSVTFGTWYQLALAGITAVSIAALWFAFRRDEQRAQRFLDTHPDPREDSAT